MKTAPPRFAALNVTATSRRRGIQPGEAGTTAPAVALLEELQEVMRASGDDVTPTACEAATSLLSGAQAALCGPLPEGAAIPDEGGVWVEWSHAGKELRLVVDAVDQAKTYIYHEQGSDYAVEHNPTPARLAFWLAWYSAD